VDQSVDLYFSILYKLLILLCFIRNYGGGRGIRTPERDCSL
jgi:hypothetical protein